MSLAELFYAKSHARRTHRAGLERLGRPRALRRRRRILFEALEPRLLLSADASILAAPELALHALLEKTALVAAPDPPAVTPGSAGAYGAVGTTAVSSGPTLVRMVIGADYP